ncbi:zinc-ribbon domain-containing protein [Streptococcus rifensis]
MFCPKCGTQNNTDNKFCMSCGHILHIQQSTNSNYSGSSQPKLGSHPDFYTYLCVGLNLLVIFMKNSNPGFAFIISIGAIIAGIRGLKRTTNPSLHRIVLLITLVIAFLGFISISTGGW